ncbi:hypothetical protein [Demequina activiva]|uniref:Uncharacterized protein n=1 Tax=Demequina activiva TaxID=1582364 RepID=A0A919UKE6_9MICO|nr:hypothetical protein [Demequina activiva]GIG54880.1 hypothetical protein Dac01nite_16320 [Demequina activiva]
MRELRDVLHEAFTGHARALGDSGVEVAPASALGDIRRRRARRSAVAVGGAAAACGAIAFAAVAVPAMGGDGSSVAAPNDAEGVPVPAAGAPQWCHVDGYPAPNPEAFGPAEYGGRAYADYGAGQFLFVAPDGSVEQMRRNADGDYEATGAAGITISVPGEDGPGMPYVHYAFDFFGGGGGGGPYLASPAGPQLGYEWTTEAPDDAPRWVDPVALMQVHSATLGYSGMGLSGAVAGADAVVESVLRYDDGDEQVSEIGFGEPGAAIRDFDGLVSASIRATSPEGETYEITSHYDASQTYEAACGVALPLLEEDSQDGSVPEPVGFEAGAYLEGPESDTFQCLAPVPEALIAQPSRVEHKMGSYYEVTEAGIEFDFGDGGYIVGAPEETYPGVEAQLYQYSGWSSSSFEIGGAVEGNVVYEALIWVDDDGTIIARQQHYTEEDPGLMFGPGQDDLLPLPGSLDGEHLWYIGDVSDLALACEGIQPAQIEDAELGMIFGHGPSESEMAWSVYFPGRSATD